MGWKQVRSFDPSKMGTRKGWCLQNVRLGFGIQTGHYASAKADMEAQRAAGTLHPMSELPTDRAVAVYVDTSSPYEHVIAYDHGAWWSDGKRLSSTAGMSFFGWGELCDNARVVEYTPDPTPTGFLPAKGYWCRYDKDERVARLASFMRACFPAYTPAAALGPVYGDNLWRSIAEFQRRAKAAGQYNDVIDGNTGPKTYAALKLYGFKG